MTYFETIAVIGVNVLWQSVLLALVVYGALALLPSSQIKTRYHVALGGLLGTALLLVMPFFPAWSFGVVKTAAQPFNSMSPELLASALPVEPLSLLPSIMQTLPHQTPDVLPALLAVLWMSGTLIAATRLGLAGWQTGKLRRRLRPARTYGQGGLSRPVTIMSSPDVVTPMVFGLLGPTIVVPTDLDLDLSKIETRVVLEHEIAHIVRGDLWMNLAQRIVLALMWWCLPLYWINRQIGAERENLCDAMATAHITKTSPNINNPARVLASVLIGFAEQRSTMSSPVLAIGIHSYATQLAKRVQRLCDTKPVPRLSKKLWPSSFLAIPLTLVMLSSITPRVVAAPPPLESSNLLANNQTHNSKPGQTVVNKAATESDQTPEKHTKIVTGRMTSKFGTVRKKFGGKMHKGIDIANNIGTPVFSPQDALIIQAADTYKESTKWGKVVVIETKGGVQTIFAHLDGYSVSAGQTIKAGTQIGQMGNTGNSTGPHVHIGTLVNGQYVDPLTVWPSLRTP
ncbi:MAG: hypothetical protein COA91_02340 [Robiginitomaculum sp.]|nr:MAG: hypothetical protein COA91_02340 [Robiginitomaculum sp.]